MRIEILTFLIAGAGGWIGGSLFNQDSAPHQPVKADAPSENRPNTANAVDWEAADFATKADFASELGKASASQIEQWLFDLLKDGAAYGSSNRSTMELLLRRLAALDPERALDFLNVQIADSVGSLRDLRRIVIGEWARSDVAGAVARALEIDPEGEILPLFEPLSLEKSEELYGLLKARGQDSAYLGNLLSFMSRQEGADLPDIALRAMELEKWGSDHGLEAVMGQWSSKDPDAALDWIDKLGDQSRIDRALSALATGWMRNDAAGALDRLWPRMNSQQRMQVTRNLGSVYGAKFEVEKMIDWLDEHATSPGVHAAAIAAIAERVVNSSEPAAVARFVDRAGDEAAQLSGVVKKAVTAWCKQDEKAAKSWVATLDDPALKNSALLGLVYGNLKNPVEAARMLREEIEFEEGRTDPNIAGRLIIEMVPLGMEPQEIVDAFPESLRSDAAGRYADMYADRFPSKVLDFIKTQPMDGEMPYAIRKAVDRLYVEDSAAAIAWVEGADSEAHRKEAMATLVQSWAADDAAAATDWLAAQPDDSAKQAATAQLVESLQVSNPEQAFDLAREITNVRERDKALSSMIEEIARRDPAQAATTLDSAPLSPKALQNIEEQIATSRQLREALLNGNFNPGTQR